MSEEIGKTEMGYDCLCCGIGYLAGVTCGAIACGVAFAPCGVAVRRVMVERYAIQVPLNPSLEPILDLR